MAKTSFVVSWLTAKTMIPVVIDLKVFATLGQCLWIIDRISWQNTIIYGAIGPLWLNKREGHLAQSAEGMKQHGNGDAGGFYPGSGR